MIAIVQKVREGKVEVRVRRNHRNETLQGHHEDLKLGDRVQVQRQTNNPYLIRVRVQEQEE